MTIEQCYAVIGGSYAEVSRRLPSRQLVEKFARKFPEDPSYAELIDAVVAGDRDTAFRAAHTLKGVAANLSFSRLCASARQLTELLRPTDTIPPEASSLLEAVTRDYEATVSAIRAFRKDVTVLTHSISNLSPDFNARMDNAKALLTQYASAEIVFTRRLHCAMACLAVGTPVLLLYHPEYEDISRFAPMDAMVRKQPMDDFLRELRAHGMPAPWRNPADVGAIRRIMLTSLSDGLRRAESQPLPIVPVESAQHWKQERIRRMMKSAAGKIQVLENQHYQDLHTKFTQLMQEEDVKSTLLEMLALPEVEDALRAASLRLKLEACPPKEHKALKEQHKRHLLDVDDLIRKAHGALTQLGWPENNDE